MTHNIDNQFICISKEFYIFDTEMVVIEYILHFISEILLYLITQIIGRYTRYGFFRLIQMKKTAKRILNNPESTVSDYFVGFSVIAGIVWACFCLF